MDKKFIILGEEIVITPEMEQLLTIQTGYRYISQHYIEIIDKQFYSFFTCFEDFLVENKLESMVKHFIGLIIEFTTNGLSELNLELDSNSVDKIENHIKQLTIFNVINEFKKIYGTVLDAKEQSRNMREIRKTNSPYFEGFGFGVSGAIKGAIKAELANIGIGAIYSVVNSIGNAKTEYQVKSTLDKIFNDPNTKESILQIFYNDLISFYYLLREIMNDLIPLSKRCYCYGPSDYDKARSLYKKIVNVDEYINDFKDTIESFLNDPNLRYTKQMAKKHYDDFYKELNESNKENDIKEILKVFPLEYDYFKLYFDECENIDEDIAAYAELCGFNIDNLIYNED